MPRKAEAAQLQAETLDWCRSFFAGEDTDLEPVLAHLDPGLFPILVYPGARGEAARFISDFMAWWFLLDDRLESCHDRVPPAEERHRLFYGYLRGLKGEGRREGDPFAQAARDLGRRLSGLANSDLRRRFLDAMEGWFFQGIVRELALCGSSAGIDPEGYFRIRPFSSGALPTLYLAEMVSSTMPPGAPLVRELLERAGAVIYLGNDIFSWRKEAGRPRSLNLAHILRRGGGMDESGALFECARFHNEAAAAYREIKARLREGGACPWLEGVDDALAGLIAWQGMAGRYGGREPFWYWVES